ncbi:hypothetical protein DFA_06325 [Cavenderia fasciculata]|uniref:DUF637 domain-containing protein n=1 Tax=Cavenderia fasciculata TaxID=261658 RepID=F4PKQ4_CACFS|nr:uncharacterized protein DFA_06325 [Cavenderia fasciculata]EGG24178.1 hypothetical protein DFA_06325 [Cavenderia fasciculata]|eukprot:XP_004362029.1 hypothetical protein DFA_06325 [Cavenderia fasciculata]
MNIRIKTLFIVACLALSVVSSTSLQNEDIENFRNQVRLLRALNEYDGLLTSLLGTGLLGKNGEFANNNNNNLFNAENAADEGLLTSLLGTGLLGKNGEFGNNANSNLNEYRRQLAFLQAVSQENLIGSVVGTGLLAGLLGKNADEEAFNEGLLTSLLGTGLLGKNGEFANNNNNNNIEEYQRQLAVLRALNSENGLLSSLLGTGLLGKLDNNNNNNEENDLVDGLLTSLLGTGLLGKNGEFGNNANSNLNEYRRQLAFLQAVSQENLIGSVVGTGLLAGLLGKNADEEAFNEGLLTSLLGTGLLGKNGEFANNNNNNNIEEYQRQLAVLRALSSDNGLLSSLLGTGLLGKLDNNNNNNEENDLVDGLLTFTPRNWSPRERTAKFGNNANSNLNEYRRQLAFLQAVSQENLIGSVVGTGLLAGLLGKNADEEAFNEGLLTSLLGTGLLGKNGEFGNNANSNLNEYRRQLAFLQAVSQENLIGSVVGTGLLAGLLGKNADEEAFNDGLLTSLLGTGLLGKNGEFANNNNNNNNIEEYQRQLAVLRALSADNGLLSSLLGTGLLGKLDNNNNNNEENDLVDGLLTSLFGTGLIGKNGEYYNNNNNNNNNNANINEYQRQLDILRALSADNGLLSSLLGTGLLGKLGNNNENNNFNENFNNEFEINQSPALVH